MVLDRLDRARVSGDTIAVFDREIGQEGLQPFDERRAVGTSLLGVGNDRVERRGCGAITFEEATNVARFVLVRVEGC